MHDFNRVNSEAAKLQPASNSGSVQAGFKERNRAQRRSTSHGSAGKPSKTQAAADASQLSAAKLPNARRKTRA